ncbi:MAG: SH3 domain-containing protein [Alphaproteobacteria bacterium]|nr:SH3 domain-containing protein [Alphaproteobacteria bacterium]
MFSRPVFILFLLMLSLFLAAPAAPARAEDIGSVTKLPLPRFVSLRSDTVYVRAGPGMRFPVKWVYQRRSYPLQVVQEFDTWRKIRDSDGDEGWVHQSLLSGNRHVLVAGQIPVTIYKKPESDARPVAQIEPGVVAKLNECEDDWCDVSVSGYEGWLLKSTLWGVYEHEESE